jgi:hypothetical protein
MAARMERFGLAPRCGCVEVKLRRQELPQRLREYQTPEYAAEAMRVIDRAMERILLEFAPALMPSVNG